MYFCFSVLSLSDDRYTTLFNPCGEGSFLSLSVVIGAKSFSHELTTNKTFMVHQSTYMHPQQFWEKIMNYCFNASSTHMVKQ